MVWQAKMSGALSAIDRHLSENMIMISRKRFFDASPFKKR